jgi:hypothetical protein
LETSAEEMILDFSLPLIQFDESSNNSVGLKESVPPQVIQPKNGYTDNDRYGVPIPLLPSESVFFRSSTSFSGNNIDNDQISDLGIITCL